MKHHTKPLCEHTQQLRAHNTHKHFVALMENKLRNHNTHNYCVTQMENNCRDYMLIRVSPICYITQNNFVGRHNQELCEQTQPLRAHNTHKHCIALMENKLRNHNTHNYCVTPMEKAVGATC